MKNLLTLGLLMAALLSCSAPKKEVPTEEKTSEIIKSIPGEVKILTKMMEINMPDTLLSGLNHLTYENQSSMVHLLLFNKVPDTITVDIYASQLTKPFQEVMDAITENEEPTAQFPDWLAAMVNTGGVGLIGPGQTGQTYVDFPPGNYVVECYIKSEGVFHSSTGMLKQITIVDEKTGLKAPESKVTLALSPAGIAIEGQLPDSAGKHTFKVSHGETKLYDNFTRPDVNLARVTDEDGLASLEDYMDWRKPNGMVIQSPVEFLGGAQEMPEGNVSYFTVDLKPGRYVLIGEVPQPKADGFYHEFEVK